MAIDPMTVKLLAQAAVKAATPVAVDEQLDDSFFNNINGHIYHPLVQEYIAGTMKLQ